MASTAGRCGAARGGAAAVRAAARAPAARGGAPRRSAPRAAAGGARVREERVAAEDGGALARFGAASASFALAASLALAGAPAALADTKVAMTDLRAVIGECDNKGPDNVASLGGGVSGMSSQFTGEIEQRCLYITAHTSNPSKGPLYKADVYGTVFDSRGEGAVDKCKSSANVCGTGKLAFAPEIPPGEGEITISIPMVRSKDLEAALQKNGMDELDIKEFYASGVAGRRPPVQPGALGQRYGASTGEVDLDSECEEFGIGCDDDLIGF